MDNTSVVEKIIRSLAFEVEATPQDTIKARGSSKNTPVNVKIRVRKKNEALLQEGVITISKYDNTENIPQRVRLISSDQTIMSFNVYVELEKDKKLKKHILKVLKPGCLSSAKDDDDHQYLPSKLTNKLNSSVESQSDGVLRQNISLRKGNLDIIDRASTLPNKETYFLGKCKRGGCLDPPFGEDIYAYKPKSINQSRLGCGGFNRKNPETRVSLSNKRSSISERSSPIYYKNQIEESLSIKNASNVTHNPDSVIKLYQTNSMKRSISNTYSNSIITYLSTAATSDVQIQENKFNNSRNLIVDLPKKSFIEVFYNPRQKNVNEAKLELVIKKEHIDKRNDSDSSSNKEYNDNILGKIREEIKLKHFNQTDNVKEARITIPIQNNEYFLNESQNNVNIGYENSKSETANCKTNDENSISDYVIEENISQKIIKNDNIKIPNVTNLLIKQDSTANILKSQRRLSPEELLNSKDYDSNYIFTRYNSSDTNIKRDDVINVINSFTLNLSKQSKQFSSDKSESKPITKSQKHELENVQQVTTLIDFKKSKNLKVNTIKTNETDLILDNIQNKNNHEIISLKTNEICETYPLLDKKQNLLLSENDHLNRSTYEIEHGCQELSHDVSRKYQDKKQDINVEKLKDSLKDVETSFVLYSENDESSFNHKMSHIQESHKVSKKLSNHNAFKDNHLNQHDYLILNETNKFNISIKESENKPLETQLIKFEGRDKTKNDESLTYRDKFESNIYKITNEVYSITNSMEIISNNNIIYNKNEDVGKDYENSSKKGINLKTGYDNANIIDEIKNPIDFNRGATYRVSYVEGEKVRNINLSIDDRNSSTITQENMSKIDHNNTDMDEVASINKINDITGKNDIEIYEITTVLDENISTIQEITGMSSKTTKSTDEEIGLLERKSTITKSSDTKECEIKKNGNKKGGAVKIKYKTIDQIDSKMLKVTSSTNSNNSNVEKQSNINNKVDSKTSEMNSNTNEHNSIIKNFSVIIQSLSKANKISSNITESASIVQSKISTINNETAETDRSGAIKENMFTVETKVSSKDEIDRRKCKTIFILSENKTQKDKNDEKNESFFNETTTYIDESFKKMNVIASDPSQAISNADDINTKLIKNNASNNNINAMVANVEVSHKNILAENKTDGKHSNGENMYEDSSRDIIRKEKNVLCEFDGNVPEVDYLPLKLSILTSDSLNSNSESQDMSRETSQGRTQKTKIINSPVEYNASEQKINNEEIEKRNKFSFISDNLEEIDDIHIFLEKYKLKIETNLNNDIEYSDISNKLSITSPFKNSNIFSQSFMKSHSNDETPNSNINFSNQILKSNLKSNLEQSKDNKHVNSLIKLPIHKTSYLQAITDKEKLMRNYTKSYLVSASIAPTSTVKNIKVPVTVNLGFQSYINNNNERIFKTIDNDKEVERHINDTVTIVKSLIRLPSKEIIIPFDEENDISIKIFKSNISNQHLRVSDTLTDARELKHDLKIKQKIEVADNSIRDIQHETKNTKQYNNAVDDSLISIYEKDLVPLRKVIKNLKDDIDLLAGQQLMFREQLQRVEKCKSNRLINVNRKCGCLKK